MNKSYIILVVLLLLSFGGTYGVYLRYVMPMKLQLIEHQNEVELLESKIKDLENDFDKSFPEDVIQLEQEKKQPWFNASKIRTAYFQLEEIEEIEMPEGVIPRFWYSDEHPRLKDALYQEAFEKKIILGNINFDIQPPSAFEGKNPKKEEILQEVNKYNYGIHMTRIIFAANPATVDNVEIWPRKPPVISKSGTLEMRTIGYKITITYENLLKFLQKMKLSEYYVTINAIKVSSRTLRYQKSLLNVELLLTQANFVTESTSAATPGVGTAASGGINFLNNSRTNNSSSGSDQDKMSFVDQFKQLFGL